jgi:hypothetical protein
MEWRHLRCVEAGAEDQEDQHDGHPALRLPMAQPRLSRQIQDLDHAIERLKSAFFKTPWSRLCATEIARLIGTDANRCAPILEALVSAGFLTRGHGRVCRGSEP